MLVRAPWFYVSSKDLSSPLPVEGCAPSLLLCQRHRGTSRESEDAVVDLHVDEGAVERADAVVVGEVEEALPLGEAVPE